MSAIEVVDDLNNGVGSLPVGTKVADSLTVPTVVADSLTVGTKVEANFQGKGDYYLGTIARDQGNNTFDIDYDDGEKEKGVSKERIRNIPTSAGELNKQALLQSKSKPMRGGSRKRKSNKKRKSAKRTTKK
jgi:hypothetical protein